jgi:hypothetical protein
MSTISAGTSSGTALVTSGDTTGQLVLQTNGTTTAVTIGTNQVVTLAQPLPVASGGTGSTTGVNLATGATGTLGVANGGTGATSLTANNVLLGNGTSALQVVAPGTNGNVLTSNGTTWTSAAAPSGALTLLQTVTASSSSTVDLSTGIGSTYDFYLVTFTNITSTASANLRLQVNESGSYSNTWFGFANGGYANGSGNLAINTNGGSVLQLTLSTIPPLSSGGGYGSTVSGELWFSNPTSTTLNKVVNFVTSAVNSFSPEFFATQGGGVRMYNSYDPPPAWTGLRFAFSSGNINTGVFRLYGLKNS